MQAESKIRLSPVLKTGWRILWLLLGYSLIWYILSGSKPASWILGVPAVLLAVTVTLFLSPRPSNFLNPAAALLFVPYFVYLSILSGIDVMRRTFSPEVRIDPGLLTYRTNLTGSSRVFLANIISLLPGTLSADLQDDEIVVHVLDTGIPARKNLQKLEKFIVRIFLRPDPEGEN